ncbi:uncharacterized protein K460DRAFT_368088 [Cucurbitaria berberidis CBS 394.84]|uniref:DUF7053 domain-containing protein n=1 Tax=Cucurbitaria berberidis CBS 394.84 TaxID=1168544 RepID=A0A9P4L5X6_9PLEO|nr:uncharacterized protein K460DRAFT_368088 [Cucurbitaria berberidis CBS 394.84]KAF1843170.1 hypothetical protein K460DRAFT_368088 [Cucurbitaria berberidis CBS 394.84]
MFSFNTTTNLHHVTLLPRGTEFQHALSHLHNHDLLIRLDPELAHYETLPADPANPNAKRYKVTDHMHTLPKGLWDTTVAFEADITDTDDGILWAIKAPLGLVQRTTWRLLKTETLAQEDVGGVAESERGEWSLVEDVEIKANRMLVGTVKGKCEENWRGVHARFVGHLKGEAVKS